MRSVVEWNMLLEALGQREFDLTFIEAVRQELDLRPEAWGFTKRGLINHMCGVPTGKSIPYTPSVARMIELLDKDTPGLEGYSTDKVKGHRHLIRWHAKNCPKCGYELEGSVG